MIYKIDFGRKLRRELQNNIFMSVGFVIVFA